MEEAVLVHVGEAGASFKYDAFDDRFGHAIALILDVFVHLEDVLLGVLEYEVQLVVLAQRLLQLDDVLVVQLPERLDLAQVDALVPARVLALDALDGDDFFVRDGLREVDDTERPLVERLGYTGLPERSCSEYSLHLRCVLLLIK